MAARVGFELGVLWTQGTELTTEPPRKNESGARRQQSVQIQVNLTGHHLFSFPAVGDSIYCQHGNWILLAILQCSLICNKVKMYAVHCTPI